MNFDLFMSGLNWTCLTMSCRHVRNCASFFYSEFQRGGRSEQSRNDKSVGVGVVLPEKTPSEFYANLNGKESRQGLEH